MDQPTEAITKRIAFTVSGQVQEGEAQGSTSQIDSLRADLRKGPYYARVMSYEEKDLDLDSKQEEGAEEGFRVVR
ncbi:hypothetical protein sscle_10g079360 [Sclerotinia sclerotiorum 1980 UF-70]|uniref:Acylphosphatase-like domain-containing protein n=1 Tax=Sclerotinia sclerotiorum (strain ATCC 18683 / 1980 / Ss-1) TaxID=665079 RepID=A0A1D9QDY1_SCLS1|nr:hypothetical protein sscle_10g079360 [Sclerotinia sclerotiorum 1980 UF-70]